MMKTHFTDAYVHHKAYFLIHCTRGCSVTTWVLIELQTLLPEVRQLAYNFIWIPAYLIASDFIIARHHGKRADESPWNFEYLHCRIKRPGSNSPNIWWIPVWISNYIHYRIWGESIYQFPNSNGSAKQKFLSVIHRLNNMLHQFGAWVITLYLKG